MVYALITVSLWFYFDLLVGNGWLAHVMKEGKFAILQFIFSLFVDCRLLLYFVIMSGKAHCSSTLFSDLFDTLLLGIILW